MAIEGKRILLIEDEPGMVTLLTDRLINKGYIVIHAGDGLKGEQMARDRTIDLIILDETLPRKGGIDVCRDLRSLGIATPVMMLTDRGQVKKTVSGQKSRADFHMRKPPDMPEFLERVESLLRQAQTSDGAEAGMLRYMFGSVTIDFGKREVLRDGRMVDLSGKEFELLKYFIENRSTALSRETILNAVWGYESLPTTRTIDTHVTWLRQKLEEDPRHPSFFLTVHGVGYRFVG
jgi:DNA-binding response OmpR family regulator